MDGAGPYDVKGKGKDKGAVGNDFVLSEELEAAGSKGKDKGKKGYTIPENHGGNVTPPELIAFVGLEDYCSYQRTIFELDKVQNKFEGDDKNIALSAIKETMDWATEHMFRGNRALFALHRKRLEDVLNPIKRKLFLDSELANDRDFRVQAHMPGSSTDARASRSRSRSHRPA